MFSATWYRNRSVLKMYELNLIMPTTKARKNKVKQMRKAEQSLANRVKRVDVLVQGRPLCKGIARHSSS